MPKCLRLALFVLFCLFAVSCSSSQRFMNFDWQTPRQVVIDSIRSWGFTFNSDKQRWDNGALNGFRCSKLKVWFSEKDLLDGVEAKYLDLDTASSQTIFDRYVEQT